MSRPVDRLPSWGDPLPPPRWAEALRFVGFLLLVFGLLVLAGMVGGAR